MKVLPQAALQPAQLELHLGAQLGVQGGHGLVQQQHVGLVDQGPGQGHPLLLPAGELVGVAAPEAFQVQHVQRVLHPPAGLLGREAAGPQAEGDVLGHVQVGEQGVVLEDGVDRAGGWPAAPRCPCRSRSTRPWSASSSPATMRSRVVLPQPEGPRIVTNSPLGTVRDTSRRTSV